MSAISRVVLPPWGGCRRDYAEAFIAGFMPEGRGAGSFPVLNVFLHVDRVLTRDFSMMIQSIGMTSAIIFILSQKDTVVNDYEPLLAFVPVCFVGLPIGMALLQHVHVYHGFASLDLS